MGQKLPFFKTTKGLMLLGFIIISIIGIPLSVYFLQQQQIFAPRAWHTAQSASAACGNDGKIVISVQFTNSEAAGAANSMNVIVSHPSTGDAADLGQVDPGETANGAINTDLTSIPAGAVSFALTWSDGHGTPDTKSATYPAVEACAEPTITVTEPPITITEPPVTITEPPITITEPPATITQPPSTNTPTLTPTIVISQVTIAPTGPNDLLFGLGSVSVMLTIVGGLIFILL